jgi:hypothetical protein
MLQSDRLANNTICLREGIAKPFEMGMPTPTIILIRSRHYSLPDDFEYSFSIMLFALRPSRCCLTADLRHVKSNNVVCNVIELIGGMVSCLLILTNIPSFYQLSHREYRRRTNLVVPNIFLINL